MEKSILVSIIAVFAVLTLMSVVSAVELTDHFDVTISGADVFTNEILAEILKAFSDVGLGSDVFNIPFRAMKFQDLGLGADVWRGANLIEAPLIIVTADGKVILRISRGTKKEPDYISLS